MLALCIFTVTSFDDPSGTQQVLEVPVFVFSRDGLANHIG
jgi:hypothetical protein